jgi:hypothetical protein
MAPRMWPAQTNCSRVVVVVVAVHRALERE